MDRVAKYHNKIQSERKPIIKLTNNFVRYLIIENEENETKIAHKTRAA